LDHTGYCVSVASVARVAKGLDATVIELLDGGSHRGMVQSAAVVAPSPLAIRGSSDCI